MEKIQIHLTPAQIIAGFGGKTGCVEILPDRSEEGRVIYDDPHMQKATEAALLGDVFTANKELMWVSDADCPRTWIQMAFIRADNNRYQNSPPDRRAGGGRFKSLPMSWYN